MTFSILDVIYKGINLDKSMHELSLTQNLLNTALEKVDRKRIVSVDLLIGPFSDDREEAIRFYWRDLARGTAGEGAQLHFRHTQADIKCLACGAFVAEEEGSICTYCHGSDLQLPGKDEVQLERVVMG